MTQSNRSSSAYQAMMRRTRRWLRHRFDSLRSNRFIGIILTVLLVILTSLSVLVVDSTNRLQRASESLNRDLITISEKSATEITLDDIETLDESIADLLDLTERTRLFTLPLRPIATLNTDWRTSLQSLDVTRELALSAQTMLDGVQPVLVFVYSTETETPSTDMTSGARITDLLEFSVPNFELAAEHLEEAENRLNTIRLNNVSIEQVLRYDTLVNMYEQLGTYNNVLLNGADVLSTMLGIDDETSYLVLAQNNDEIRPSGGFIGSYGWFIVQNGRIVDFDYSPSDDNNPNPPPDDFVDTLDIPDWWIRYENPVYAAWDGSWHVDFSMTAELAATYYEAGNNPNSPIDAVIAIDIRGFELLLDVLGDVPVLSYGVTVNRDNFRDVVYDIRSDGAAADEHKIFLAAVYQAIHSEWSRLPETELPKLLAALLTGLQEKHILLYYTDNTAQAAIENLGWGGQQLSGNGYDYLLVADANISGNKSNNSIQRSIAYDVEILLDGSINQRLAIQYDYLDTIAQDDAAVNPRYHGPLIYLNRLQLFTPAMSQLIESDNLQQVTSFETPDHMQHVTRIQVNYDTTERFEFTYETPAVIEDIGRFSRYRLLIQKQPGVRDESVVVRVVLPPDAEFINASPETEAVFELEQISLDFFINLTSDQWIDVIFEQP